MAGTYAAMRAFRARRLRHYRIECKLTQAALAKQAGVTTNAISQYENGIAEPRLQVLDRLLDALGCTYEDLRCGENLPDPPKLKRKPRARSNQAASRDTIC